MVASMTGFGREVVETGRERIAAELRSVNSRGLKLTVRLPDALAAFQPEVEALVRTTVERGTVYVELDYRALVSVEAYAINRDVLKLYAAEGVAVRKELGLGGSVDVEKLMSLPGVISTRAATVEDPAVLW